MCESQDFICTILPPHILKKLAESDKHRNRALQNIALTERARGRRSMMRGLMAFGIPAGELRRTIYDEQNGENLPGKLVRGEGDGPSRDVAVNEAYDASGKTYDFYDKVFSRNSVDDRGLRLDSSVHYGVQYDNAFWDGQQMIYGDGDGELFNRFTISLDVIGHELTHGVTQYTAALQYAGQSGALNESMSDVFGSMVKQWALGQTVDQADWLIGKGLLAPGVNGVALRSMKDPGSAYDDPQLGKDPQPKFMKDYINTTEDNGGVHLNSGIPNYAFYLAAAAIGGNSWDKTGRIWYDTLTKRLTPSSDFQAAADATTSAAGDLYGANSPEQTALITAWTTVGIVPAGASSSLRAAARSANQSA
ncbi:MAG: M4 family metallopeptidase [Candidatus Acidiferrum sp.]